MGILFSGFDIRGHLADSLTPEYAWNVGKAFADWLPEDGAIVVVSEVAAQPQIVKAVVEGLRLQGRDVLDGGTGDEQVAVQVITGGKAVGGIIVGHEDLQSLETIKLLQENAIAVTSDNGLIEISNLVEAGNFVPAATKGELTTLE